MAVREKSKYTFGPFLAKSISTSAEVHIRTHTHLEESLEGCTQSGISVSTSVVGFRLFFIVLCCYFPNFLQCMPYYFYDVEKCYF